MTHDTVTIELTVTRAWADAHADRLARIPPTTAHPLPGERILALALTALDRQTKVRTWRARRAAGETTGPSSPTEAPDFDSHPNQVEMFPPTCIEDA